MADIQGLRSKLRLRVFAAHFAALVAGAGVFVLFTWYNTAFPDSYGRWLSLWIVRVQLSFLFVVLLFMGIAWWGIARGGREMRTSLVKVDTSKRMNLAENLVGELRDWVSLFSYVAWLLPVLGFIGTVIGISQAVGPLGRLIEENKIDTKAMSEVLGGLGTAFDTTLVGLLATIPVVAIVFMAEVYRSRCAASVLTLGRTP